MHLYHSPPTKSLGMGKVVTMLTSRGCPYRCNYCISSVMWGKGSVRYRSAGSVLKEMAECMERYDAREFNFHDDLFVNRKQRLIDICRGMMELESPVGWICMARADAIDEETIRWMKRAGCQKIAFGIESGSQTILKSMNKKLDISKARGAFELCRKYDIKTGASFMIGYLNETEGTIRETIEFMKELDADTVSVFQASPYPGTGFYQEAAARGFIRTDFKWEDFALVTHSKSVVDLPGLSSDRIRYWIRRAYAEYYLRPSYIVRQLSRVRSYHDLENILRGAGIFSNIMGKAKLMRRLSRR
jgi:anaerobic magnesium-protoporphyrin IX monomethyl ester cyclase